MNQVKVTLPETNILLMAEILHQLRLVVYPMIYRVLYIPGGAGFQPSTVAPKIGWFGIRSFPFGMVVSGRVAHTKKSRVTVTYPQILFHSQRALT